MIAHGSINPLSKPPCPASQSTDKRTTSRLFSHTVWYTWRFALRPFKIRRGGHQQTSAIVSRLPAIDHRSRHTTNTPSSSKLTPTRHRHDAQTIHLVNLPPCISYRRTRPSINYDFTRGNIFYSHRSVLLRSFIRSFESSNRALIYTSYYRHDTNERWAMSWRRLLCTVWKAVELSYIILLTPRNNTNTLSVALYMLITNHILEYTNTNSSSYSSNAFSIELLRSIIFVCFKNLLLLIINA